MEIEAELISEHIRKLSLLFCDHVPEQVQYFLDHDEYGLALGELSAIVNHPKEVNS